MTRAKDVRVDRATLALLTERHGDRVLDHIQEQIALGGTGPGSKRTLFDGRYEEMIPIVREGLPYVILDGLSLRITTGMPETAITALKDRPLGDLIDLGPVFSGRIIERVLREPSLQPAMIVFMEEDDVFIDFVKNSMIGEN
jgi:hypothetical protein